MVNMVIFEVFISDSFIASGLNSNYLYLDSGALHIFFFDQYSLVTYSHISNRNVRFASGYSSIIGDRTVHITIGPGLTVKVYHAPVFNCDVLTVSTIIKSSEVFFTATTNNQNKCLLFNLGFKAFDKPVHTICETISLSPIKESKPSSAIAGVSHNQNDY